MFDDWLNVLWMPRHSVASPILCIYDRKCKIVKWQTQQRGCKNDRTKIIVSQTALVSQLPKCLVLRIQATTVSHLPLPFLLRPANDLFVRHRHHGDEHVEQKDRHEHGERHEHGFCQRRQPRPVELFILHHHEPSPRHTTNIRLNGQYPARNGQAGTTMSNHSGFYSTAARYDTGKGKVCRVQWSTAPPPPRVLIVYSR